MRIRPLLPTLVIAAVILAACGGDDGEAETDDAASQVTVEATTTAADDVSTIEPDAAVADYSDLHADPADLDAAVECGASGEGATVLLIHGTGSTPEESFSESLGVTLPPLGYEVCTVALPGRSTVDIQESSEYVVAAVRSITARTGEPVALIGHSQGVLQARTAVAFWPDVAQSTSMIVAMAGPSAGSPAADAICADGCGPSLHQMLPSSAFLTGLDAAWDPDAVPVTAILTLTDEFVPPESATAIPGATVFTVQDHCPERAVSHSGLLIDTVAHAAVVSALTNDGVAQQADIDGVDCAVAYVEGRDIAPIDAATAAALDYVMSSPTVREEPPVTLGS